MRASIALAASLASSCGPAEISTVQIGEPEVRQVSVACTLPGVNLCYTCLPGMTSMYRRTMRPECSYKMSAYCMGTATAVIEVASFETKYDDGSSQISERAVRAIETGQCRE